MRHNRQKQQHQFDTRGCPRAAPGAPFGWFPYSAYAADAAAPYGAHDPYYYQQPPPPPPRLQAAWCASPSASSSSAATSLGYREGPGSQTSGESSLASSPTSCCTMRSPPRLPPCPQEDALVAWQLGLPDDLDFAVDRAVTFTVILPGDLDFDINRWH